MRVGVSGGRILCVLDGQVGDRWVDRWAEGGEDRWMDRWGNRKRND